MKVIETEIAGVKIIEPDVFGDARGWFCESCNAERRGIRFDDSALGIEWSDIGVPLILAASNA